MFSRRNFRRNRKGIGTIFGMVFFLLIVMIVFASFMVLLTQNTGLEQTMIQTRQMDNDVAREQVRIFTASGNNQFLINQNSTSITVSCNINNTGTVPIQIIRVWVKDQSTMATGSASIPSAQSIIQQGKNQPYNIPVNVQISDLNQTIFWFVTARGNLFNQYSNQGPQGATGAQGVMGPNGTTTSAQVAQGIGSIMMNFTDFSYFNVTRYGANPSSYTYSIFPSGNLSGYSVTQGTAEGILFRLKVTNLDLRNRTIILNAGSVLWCLFPNTIQQPRGAAWYLVNINPTTGLITNNVSNVTLTPGIDTYLYFAALNQMTSNNFALCKSAYTGTAAVNLALVGTANTDYFGQNLPFVSITIT